MKTFMQWINEENSTEGSPLVAMNSKTVKTKRDRDRLARV